VSTPRADAGLLHAVAVIARRAGAVILDVYARPFDVQHKADGSPVTEADQRAEALIVGALEALTPGLPVVAEEAHAGGTVPAAAAIAARFWLVDPLDGTREFAARNGEFTVNIALVEHGVPVLGVVAAPALGCLYAGVIGAGAWREQGGHHEPIHARNCPAAGATVALSRSHLNAATEAWLRGRAVASRVGAGSSLKFGLVAAGEADWYPRLSRTMEWDTAAGHAVLRAAGGEVRTLDGAPLGYGKPGFENPHFVAHGAGPCPG
jgi:3'(2'), 5'-bisphosphate nucleotidase